MLLFTISAADLAFRLISLSLSEINFVDFVVIIKCVAVAAGYMNLATSIISKLPFETGFEWIDKRSKLKGQIIVFICCALTIPSTLQPSLTRLKNFSYLGIFSILLLIVISIIQTKNKVSNVSSLIVTPNILDDIGSFVFGFTCHQSILNIHNETLIRDRIFKIIVVVAFVLVGTLYYTFGYINYKAFAGDNLANISEIFSVWINHHPISTYFGALVFSLSLIVSVPFQIHPAKTYLGDMLSFKYFGRFVSVICMMTICYLLSNASFYKIRFVSSYVTKPMNTFLCFIFPLFFLLLNKNEKSRFDWFVCLYLGLFAGLCIYSYF